MATPKPTSHSMKTRLCEALVEKSGFASRALRALKSIIGIVFHSR